MPLWVTMNCLSLTQAFKFYYAQDESTRFAISQEFQRMHREAHGGTARRVTHASLERTFDHVKDFRNICAHDERLYCARVDKSQSTDVKRLFQDMRTVLTRPECESLAAGVLEALDFAEASIESVDVREVVRGMGFSSKAEIGAVLEGKC